MQAPFTCRIMTSERQGGKTLFLKNTTVDIPDMVLCNYFADPHVCSLNLALIRYKIYDNKEEGRVK